jgi:hypothetical protein
MVFGSWILNLRTLYFVLWNLIRIDRHSPNNKSKVQTTKYEEQGSKTRIQRLINLLAPVFPQSTDDKSRSHHLRCKPS